MVAYPSLATAIFAADWLSLVNAGYSGVLPSQFAELSPTRIRGIGVSLSFAVAVMIFGGLHAVCCDLAHRSDRQQPVTELLHNVHCRAQHPFAAPPVSAVEEEQSVALMAAPAQKGDEFGSVYFSWRLCFAYDRTASLSYRWTTRETG
jgi:hypothetical protein